LKITRLLYSSIELIYEMPFFDCRIFFLASW